MNDMMETMAPLLLSEGMASLNRDYQRERRGSEKWNRDMYRLRLTKLTNLQVWFAFLIQVLKCMKLNSARLVTQTSLPQI